MIHYHAPSRAREVYDVSGAGDTAIALFTLAMVSGATPIEAAEISNHASSVVVAKLGTATLTPDELLKSFRLNNGEVGLIVPKDARGSAMTFLPCKRTFVRYCRPSEATLITFTLRGH